MGRRGASPLPRGFLPNTLVVCCVQPWLVGDAALLQGWVQAVAASAEVHGSFP